MATEKKLFLSTETLRRLDTAQLRGLAAGTGQGVEISCAAPCSEQADCLTYGPLCMVPCTTGEDDTMTITVRPVTRGVTDNNCF